jgi:hypothetical protein
MGKPVGDRGSDKAVYVFVYLGIVIVCRLYKLTLSDKDHVILQLRVILYNLIYIHVTVLHRNRFLLKITNQTH